MKTIIDQKHGEQNTYSIDSKNTHTISNPYELVVSLDNEVLARQQLNDHMSVNNKNNYIRSIN